MRNCSSSFPQYFQYISNSKSPVTYIFVKCGSSNYFFLKSANLICRSTDISKYSIESLGFRDNKSTVFVILCAHLQCQMWFVQSRLAMAWRSEYEPQLRKTCLLTRVPNEDCVCPTNKTKTIL